MQCLWSLPIDFLDVRSVSAISFHFSSVDTSIFCWTFTEEKNEDPTWTFMNSDSRSWSIIISIYSLWHYCTRSATCVAFDCKGLRHRPINDDILHERLRDGILRMICLSSAISSKICDTVTSSSDSTIRSEMISFKFCVIGISTICLSIRSETYVFCFDQRVTLCCSITIFSNLIISLEEWF